jgi:hypothetical protein
MTPPLRSVNLLDRAGSVNRPEKVLTLLSHPD